MSTSTQTTPTKQFEQARTERDRLYERYEAALADGDDENATLWLERWEVECARVERMRLPRKLPT